jgi:glycosyltransferase involved in cell wall biosynthesis
MPEKMYPSGTIDFTIAEPNLENINVKSSINFNNPFTWIKSSIVASGEIIHIQHWVRFTTFIYCFMVPILKLRGKKILFNVHNITPHDPAKYIVFYDRILNRFVFRFADCFIVHNERNKKRFKELYKVKNKEIFVIGLGGSVPQIFKNISKKKAREQLNIKMNKKVLLSFGYIWDYKGIDILLFALEKITKEVDDVLLIIAGQPLHDWNKYQKIIQKRNLDKFILQHIKYISEQDVELFFSASDLIVLPYVPPFDTHGGVAAFAIGMKKPLIVSDIGGLPEFVKDKKAIVKSGDIEDLTIKIINILRDKQLLSKLKKDSISISKDVTWDSIAKKTIKVYGHMVRFG